MMYWKGDELGRVYLTREARCRWDVFCEVDALAKASMKKTSRNPRADLF